jgi:uncharacterized membrane protein YadS
LAPLLAGVAITARRRADHREEPGVRRPPLLPLFIVLFLAAVVVRTTGVIPETRLPDIKTAETLLLGMGLVGLGSNVDLRRLRAVGGRPLALGLGSWVLVAVVSWVAVELSGW